MSVAEQPRDDEQTDFALTADVADWVANLRPEDLSERSLTWAKHALLDWLGVTIAAANEPLVAMLLEEFAGDSAAACTIVGQDRKADLHGATLINGAASHALDYDDVSRAMHGHPSVPVAPAVLALGEVSGASGRDMLTAFVAGVEVECALGDMTHDTHYDKGFHATGTLGTFGAAAAAANLMRLDAATTARALGLAASQASGLKCNFGTMTKPFHAGKAAANGLSAARLAARGFTAHQEAIETEQGFAATQAPDFFATPLRPDPSAPYAVESTLFKYHASCFSTHSTIDAINDLRGQHGIGLDDMARLTIVVHPRHFGVCCIPEPTTGLEVKFSIRHLAVMALDGIDTGGLEVYSDANANDPRYVTARRLVDIETQPQMDRMTSAISLQLKDGRVLHAEGDVGQPASNLNEQWSRLSNKFRAIASPVIGDARAAELVDVVGSLESAQSPERLLELA